MTALTTYFGALILGGAVSLTWMVAKGRSYGLLMWSAACAPSLIILATLGFFFLTTPPAG